MELSNFHCSISVHKFN